MRFAQFLCRHVQKFGSNELGNELNFAQRFNDCCAERSGKGPAAETTALDELPDAAHALHVESSRFHTFD